MGFSLVGNSGSTNTSTTSYNYSASQNPQLDFEGATNGTLGVNISPLSEGGSTGEIDSSVYDYYAPVDIVNTGTATGDAALAALQQTSQSLSSASGDITTTPASSLSTLFSGNTIYWIIGSIVVFFLAED